MENKTVISVQHLTKRFAGTVAVNDVSFDVDRGEVVGFLGPNGAGKTTTMRILAGFLSATGGEVRVAGHDVFEDSMEVRRRIGYLPENVPLYAEMRVREYLRYRAELKGLHGRRRRQRTREVLDQCGLGEVRKRIIGQLSKGFRQRVGLADALIHEPELLILDEPTIGLDPNQIRQIRSLIGELASRHTILLSTHILPEVEMTCRRVLIINRGQIVASDSPRNLQGLLRGGRQVIAEIKGPREAVEDSVGALTGVRLLEVESRGEWLSLRLETEAGQDPREALFALVSGRGWGMRELRRETTSLEDVFVALTKGEEAS